MSVDFSSLSPEQQQALLDGPALYPPPGVVPNFGNPPNHDAAGLAVVIVLFVLTTLAAVLYAWGRFFVVKQVRFYDLVGLAAYGVYVALVWSSFRGYKYTGFFIHQWDIQYKVIGQFILSYSYANVLYIYAIMLAKDAILLQWMHIFVPKGTRNAFFWIACVLIAVITLYSIAASLVVIIPCAPFEAHIDELATCIPDIEVLDLLSASINLVLDLSILILPLHVIWRLNMSRERRLGLTFVFLVGVVACLAAVARIAVSIYYYRTPSFSADSTYSLSLVTIVALVEVTAAMLVFYVPGTPKTIQAMYNSVVMQALKSWTASSVQSLLSRTRRGSSDERSSGRGSESSLAPHAAV